MLKNVNELSPYRWNILKVVDHVIMYGSHEHYDIIVCRERFCTITNISSARLSTQAILTTIKKVWLVLVT